MELHGNIVVGQSGGPTAAINATLSGVIRGGLEAIAAGTAKKIYGMRHGIEGLLSEQLIDLGERFADEGQLELLEHTPAAALGSCRKKLPRYEDDPALYEKLLGIFKKYDIRYFFYIGGNDSMDTAAKLSAYTRSHDYEMRVIGVPKTIDNDLVGTDHTPGFGSAAKYIAVTLQEIIRDCSVYTVPAVTIVEIMGRDAGWLTAAAGIGRAAGGSAPDLIYLPERSFDLEAFYARLRERLALHPAVVVAVSEGIRFADGRYVCEGVDVGTTDVFGHKQLSGTGKALELAVRAELGCKVRSIELNLPQRCAAHIASAQDLCESVCVGREAVRAARDGVSCEMMTILREENAEGYGFRISHSDVAEIANKIKSVPDEFINEAGDDVSDSCCEYLLPLIAGEAYPHYTRGIPDQIIL